MEAYEVSVGAALEAADRLREARLVADENGLFQAPSYPWVTVNHNRS